SGYRGGAVRYTRCSQPCWCRNGGARPSTGMVPSGESGSSPWAISTRHRDPRASETCSARPSAIREATWRGTPGSAHRPMAGVVPSAPAWPAASSTSSRLCIAGASLPLGEPTGRGAHGDRLSLGTPPAVAERTGARMRPTVAPRAGRGQGWSAAEEGAPARSRRLPCDDRCVCGPAQSEADVPTGRTGRRASRRGPTSVPGATRKRSAHADREGRRHHEGIAVPRAGALELQVPSPRQHADLLLLLAGGQRAGGRTLLGEGLGIVGDVHRIVLDLTDHRVLAREVDQRADVLLAPQVQDDPVRVPGRGRVPLRVPEGARILVRDIAHRAVLADGLLGICGEWGGDD